jgi:hypothetical protein
VTSPRPDTRLLATSPITTDLSQRLTNLTASAGAGYELNSIRTGLSGEGAGRSIELLVNINTTSVGTLVDHSTGIAGTQAYKIRVTLGGVVEFSDSSGLLMSLTTPGVVTGNRLCVVAWSTEPNPLHDGGAGTELRSEFLVYNTVAGGDPAWDTTEHDAVTPDGSATFTVGGVFTGGVLTLAYLPAITAVRISCRFHTRVETREHFVAQTAAPTNTGLAAVQQAVPPVEMFAPGQIIGPQYQHAAASMQPTRNRHRLLSPVWQWIQLNHADGAPAFTDDMRNGISPKWVLDLDDPGFVAEAGPGWQTPICWLARVQVPRHVEHLLVRVQWATWELDPIDPSNKVELQFHCADGPPRPVKDGNGFIPQFNVTSYQTIERIADDVSISGLGANQVFDFVKVERDADGFSWVWLAGRTDEGSGVGGMGYQVRSCVATPIVLGDGYGGLVANPWGP